MPYYIVLLPLSFLYGLISGIIKFSYKYGLLKIHSFPVPVVIIGNLTVGGNGKTPMVLWLVQQLQKRKWIVGVVSRGYKGYSNRYPIILNNSSITEECGDEPVLIWSRTKAFVAVSPHRVDAVAVLLKNYPSIDIIISDDGLQHYALGRNIEWVIINNKWRFGNGWWLPAGPMRERASRLRSVDAVILSDGNISHMESVSMRFVPVALVNLYTNQRQSITIFSKVKAMAGISDPKQFFDTLRAYGIVIIQEIEFENHRIYSEKLLNKLVQNDEILLMTEKDAVKCRSFARPNWWYLEIDVVLESSIMKRLLSSVEQIIWQYRGIH